MWDCCVAVLGKNMQAAVMKMSSDSNQISQRGVEKEIRIPSSPNKNIGPSLTETEMLHILRTEKVSGT